MNEPDRSNVSLEDVLAELIRRAESGQTIDKSEYLTRYPQWSDELTEFLAGRAQLERFAAQIEGAAATALATPGTRIRYIGDYELLERIGQGGMGAVYRARQVSLDRYVAVKLLTDQQYDRARFEAEAQAAASLDHPHIVSILESGEHDGCLYYAMQLVEGENLRQRIERQVVTPGEAADHARKLARAVQFAHDRGVLHRDLKPANIVLDRDNEPHITDFGLAKLLHRDMQLTDSGDVLGTPSYMAPEQAAGEARNITTATDVYGVGTILYEMLTGRPPYDSVSGAAVLRKVQEEPATSPRTLCAATPRDLETICLKCLEKQPQDRYRAAASLADDLDRYVRGEPISARPVPSWERAWRWSRRNPSSASLLVAVVALLVLTAVGGAAFAVREHAARAREALLHQQRRQALEEAEVNLINMYTDHGRAAHFEEFASEGALWYAQAAVKSQKHTERAPAAWLRASVADRRTPDPVHAVLFSDQWIRSLAFHPQDSHLLVHTDDGALYLYDMKPEPSPSASAPELQSSDPLGSLVPPDPIEVVEKVAAALWTPDGRGLIVGDQAGQLSVVDFPSAVVSQRVDVGAPIQGIAVAPDGSLVAVAAGKTLRVWALGASFQIVGAVDHPDDVVHVAFRPQGDRLLTQCLDGQVRVFDVGPNRISDEPSLPLLPQRNAVSQRGQIAPRAVFVRGGQEIMTQPDSSIVRCYDAEAGRRLREIKVAGRKPAVVDHDGRVLAASSKYSTRLWNVATGKTFRSMDHRDYPTALDFSADGQIIAIGGLDCQLRLGRAFSNSFRANIQHHLPIDAIAFANHEDLVASAQRGGLVRVWRFRRHTDPPSYKVQVGKRGSRIGLTPDGSGWFNRGGWSRYVDSQTIEVRHVENGERNGSRLPAAGIVRDAAFSQNGSIIAAISVPRLAGGDRQDDRSAAGRLSVWSWPDGERRFDPMALPTTPRSVACDPAGKRVAVQFTTGAATLIDAANGKILMNLPTPSEGATAAGQASGGVRFSRDANSLLSWNAGAVSIWDAASGEPRYPALQHGSQITRVQFSHDQTLLATSTADGVARVWRLATGDLAAAPLNHQDYLYSVRFDSEDRRLITGCADDRARIIDWRTGKVVTEVHLHHNDVFDAVLTPDDRWLISAGDNNIVAVSSARDGRFVDRLIMAPGVSGDETAERQAVLSICDQGRRIIVGGNRAAITVADFTHLTRMPRLTPAQLLDRAVLTSSKAIGSDGMVLLNVDQWCERWNEYVMRPAR